MINPHGPSSNPESETLRHRLGDLRNGLLRLHKALLEAERLTYERIHGRVPSTGQLLQLVRTDPWFAWLHPLSKLVLRIDVMLDEHDQVTTQDARNILVEARSLVRPSEHGEGFERHYYEALQRAPDAVLAHAQVKKLLTMIPA
ncbi:MAG: hypothetical protein C4293_11620 [Nitrospiraceae bacterium]